MNRFLVLLLMFVVFAKANAQTSNIDAVNSYIDFNNECTHGMLIVHRLLENFNQDVNKFVDLESHQINFYSNKDLPRNIFEDTDHWFYEKTPYEWYAELASLDLSAEWKQPLNTTASKMRQDITAINQIRFEAEQFITENDLSDRKSQEEIYKILEKGVTLFENFYKNQKVLKSQIETFAQRQKAERNDFENVHEQAYQMLESLRYKNDDNWADGIQVLEGAISSGDLKGEMKDKLNKFLLGAKEFIQTATVDAEYKLYGKYYFYHNSKLLNYVNRYGNGYANAYNESIDRKKQFKLLEIPHFYQVIYPVKWMENVPLASMDPMIQEIPDQLKERKINLSKNIIYVESDVVELEIFDHQMIDGDIVSVNFNGDWILEDFPIKGKPYPLKVKLNANGKNFLLLHAINLGKKPPNTMAVRYVYKGQKQTVVLSSDLDESEVIELKIVK
ncbi:hypothetical protein [Portibacter lacus]|nr:hypothetical protein [Portibacter lacus]